MHSFTKFSILALLSTLSVLARAAPHAEPHDSYTPPTSESTTEITYPGCYTATVTKTARVTDIATVTKTARVTDTATVTDITTVTGTTTVTDTTTVTGTTTVTSITTTILTVTTTATVAPDFCCPRTNRIANPGFEDNSAWSLLNGMSILTTNPSGTTDRNVIVAEFTGPAQAHGFSQTITGLCPGSTYNFMADIQMWTGSGSAYVDFILGGTRFLQSAPRSQGPWGTSTATVVATATSMVLTVNVVSGGEAGARRFVLDDFSLTLA